MDEPENTKDFIRKAKSMLDNNELIEMQNTMMNHPLKLDVVECQETGRYVMQFRTSYCGLNFIKQMPPRCQYLDLDNEFTDAHFESGGRIRVYNCKRLDHLMEDYFEDFEDKDEKP